MIKINPLAEPRDPNFRVYGGTIVFRFIQDDEEGPLKSKEMYFEIVPHLRPGESTSLTISYDDLYKK